MIVDLLRLFTCLLCHLFCDLVLVVLLFDVVYSSVQSSHEHLGTVLRSELRFLDVVDGWCSFSKLDTLYFEVKNFAVVDRSVTTVQLRECLFLLLLVLVHKNSESQVATHFNHFKLVKVENFIEPFHYFELESMQKGAL